MRRSLAANVRKAAQGLNEFRVEDLAEKMGVLTYGGRSRIRTCLQDFVKRGEMQRVSRGVYRYTKSMRARSKLDVIWHLVRSHRRFTTDQMERLSGAARATVLDYLRCLSTLGFLRKTGPQNWRLVSDPGPETPVNTSGCARLARHSRKAEGGRK